MGHKTKETYPTRPGSPTPCKQGLSSTVRISLPFKDQVAANAVRKQLRDLSHKIDPTLQPVFVSKKLGQDLRPKEIKPSIVNDFKKCFIAIFYS